jgi:hypothetical protein
MDPENFGRTASLARPGRPAEFASIYVQLAADYASLGRASPDDETDRSGRFTSLCARKNARRRHNQSVAEASHVTRQSVAWTDVGVRLRE